MTTRKSKTVGIHLNDDEYAEIEKRTELAAARSLGGYMKATVFNTPIPEQRTVRHTNVADPKLIRQLAWIGNNLNQISRVINQSPAISQTEAASLFAVLAIMAEELEALNKDAI